ncbi:hypothetical protein [Parachitinimonas caeni]|uniref:Uncharacterized protein n=1 Tax=Parachitinimonas caeni TaxID=3031301 RepID=A0ABT7E4R9_9NEIS|nr:hypothetical protein [Parachitinimonas caeni]MDK2125922.1 hypothetical protein [Parachitinimonas caeni]
MDTWEARIRASLEAERDAWLARRRQQKTESDSRRAQLAAKREAREIILAEAAKRGLTEQDLIEALAAQQA